jgi:NodT family efflux transporter outer membrane factor (OMF) lipoprotein
VNRQLAVVIALQALDACAVGPNYKVPSLSTQAAKPFVETPSSGMLSGGPLPADWWRLFNDATLNRLVHEAFLYNADIATAEANVRRARALVLEQQASLLPSTTLSGQSSRNRVGLDSIPPSQALSSPTSSTQSPTDFHYNYFQFGFDASYEVDVFGRVRRSIEAARRDEQANAAILDGVRISIAAQVAQSYADACGLAQQADVARETAQLQAKTLELTQLLLSEGRSTRRDVDQASTLLQQAEAQIPQLEAARSAQLYALAALTGRTPSDVDAEALGCRQVPGVTTAIPVGDGAAMLARRPDVRQAERQLAGDTARIGVATASLFPTVNLLGSVTDGATKTSQLGSSKALSYSFGPFISWSFPNILAARAKIKQARAGADASLASFQGTVLTALKETESALARYGGALQQRDAYRSAAASASDAADLTLQRFTTGRDNFLQLLVAQQNRASARATLAQAETAVADDAVGVFKALGGGWQGAPRTVPTLSGGPSERAPVVSGAAAQDPTRPPHGS